MLKIYMFFAFIIQSILSCVFFQEAFCQPTPKNYKTEGFYKNAQPQGRKCVRIALEGMAGAGKTTALLQFVSELEGVCLVLPELLPEPRADWALLPIEEQGRIYHGLWVSRMKTLNKLSSQVPCFFLDRTYFTNLAFTYATDRFLGRKQHLKEAQDKVRYQKEPCYENEYMKHKELFLKDLKNEHFDLLIILDIDPKIGLSRRHKAKDKMPWLSSEECWLRYLREFYHQELSKLYKGEIFYIDTTHLSQQEVMEKIRTKLEPLIKRDPKDTKERKESDRDVEKKLLAFGLENDLGGARSSLVYVFGYPTIYFRKYAVQLVDGKIRFLNTYQLNSYIKKKRISRSRRE